MIYGCYKLNTLSLKKNTLLYFFKQMALFPWYALPRYQY